mmetsp:Transcript_17619/g.40453  ORF Transcript_17619/g.40453 Transcript_17619/m.40453 type:complete len:279 (-) Transcript_17619:827-1663(-)
MEWGISPHDGPCLLPIRSWHYAPAAALARSCSLACCLCRCCRLRLRRSAEPLALLAAELDLCFRRSARSSPSPSAPSKPIPERDMEPALEPEPAAGSVRGGGFTPSLAAKRASLLAFRRVSSLALAPPPLPASLPASLLVCLAGAGFSPFSPSILPLGGAPPVKGALSGPTPGPKNTPFVLLVRLPAVACRSRSRRLPTSFLQAETESGTNPERPLFPLRSTKASSGSLARHSGTSPSKRLRFKRSFTPAPPAPRPPPSSPAPSAPQSKAGTGPLSRL